MIACLQTGLAAPRLHHPRRVRPLARRDAVAFARGDRSGRRRSPTPGPSARRRSGSSSPRLRGSARRSARSRSTMLSLACERRCGESCCAGWLAYRLRKPLADGRTCPYPKPQQLLAKLAALIPPPRQHRVRHYGVLAPRPGLRQAVIATAGPGEALAMQLREEAARSSESWAQAARSASAGDRDSSIRASAFRWLSSRLQYILSVMCGVLKAGETKEGDGAAR